MNLGARTAMWSGGAKPWVNPYITDGLIAMFDGEWNAGGGIHSDSLETGWTDLVSGEKARRAISASSIIVMERSVLNIGSGSAFRFILPLNVSGTIECVFKRASFATKDSPFGIAKTEGTSYRFVTAFVFGSNVTLVPGANMGVRKEFSTGMQYFSIQSKAGWPPVNDAYIDGIKYGVVSGMTNVQALGSISYYDGSPSINLLYDTWQGSMELFCVRVYSRYLSDSEVSSNLQVDKERFGIYELD